MHLLEQDNAVIVIVRVTPRSSRSEIVGVHDDALKVRLNAPPVDGAANDELLKLFAKRLGIPRSAVEIVSGETSKTKRLRISGVTAEQFRNAVG